MPNAEELVFAVVDEVNEMLPAEQRLMPSLDQQLLGSGGDGLDSLGLVTLVTAVEEHVATSVGVRVSLMDADAFEREPSPFLSFRTLVDHLGERLEAAAV
ncbi:MAG TPA: hypothetical protein VOB72_03655 [Candidatus Dormibacteraeota bacterium]|nr:hypothetical protein [Candidatus Dormibacteraeota bacterium]